MAIPPIQNYSRRQIDLTEWVGHRVLAFKDEVYHYGTILHVTQDTCDVTVRFEGDPQQIVYPDILSHPSSILSDMTPASDQVSVGSSVLVIHGGGSGGHVFVPGIVEEKSLTPQGQPLFSLKKNTRKVQDPHSVSHVDDEKEKVQMWVKRSQLRTVAAPWEEEVNIAMKRNTTTNITPGPQQLEHNFVK